MASRPYTIRWINDVKKYGLFATQEIPYGTCILQELAVMINLWPLIDIIEFWKHINTRNVSLHQKTRSDLESQTQQIVHGMHDLKTYADKIYKYEDAMNIHNRRMAEVSDLDTQIDTTTDDVAKQYPFVPIDLYQRAVAGSPLESEAVIVSLLQHSLRPINTCLRGSVLVQYPENHAWGPHTSLVNHGCRPNAMVSCQYPPSADNASLRHIGVLGLKALTTIKADEEITIEYFQVFGSTEMRRQRLRSFGIRSCQCASCEYEDELKRRSGDPKAQGILVALDERNSRLHDFCSAAYSTFNRWDPVAFFHQIYRCLVDLTEIGYHGHVGIKLYELAMRYAKIYNDNIRIYWFTHQIMRKLRTAYGVEHPLHKRIWEQRSAALEGNVWNDQTSNCYFTFTTAFTLDHADTHLIFMLDQPESSTAYFQLTINAEGRLAPITEEENLMKIRDMLIKRRLLLQETGQNQKEADRTAPANEKEELEADTDIETSTAAAAAAAAAKVKKQKENKYTRDKKKRAKQRKKTSAGAAAAMEDEAKEEGTETAAAAAAAEAEAEQEEHEEEHVPDLPSLAAPACTAGITASDGINASASASSSASAAADTTIIVASTSSPSSGPRTTSRDTTAARIAAIRAATVIPALPHTLSLPRPFRPRPASLQPKSGSSTVPPPPSFTAHPRPFHLRFRSTSFPEPATLARFFARPEPHVLHPPPQLFRDIDCISDSGMEIRFGVDVSRR